MQRHRQEAARANSSRIGHLAGKSSLESFSLELANRWGVGHKDDNADKQESPT